MTTTLLFGVHAHQPAGNFPQVLDTAHERCYRPFLETMHRFPDFRFALHASGPLLDYLLDRYPDDMRLLHEMVERGQIEMFGAGETEPVLAAIPHRDRVGQLHALSAKLERLFGERPTGAWLTERVWESTVVPALAECGIGYVTVDDYHFLCTGKTAAELDGYYTTEEGGARVDLYPISEALRYRIPFAPAEEAVAYIAAHGHAVVYFDDIEKFGIWPETHEWVYGKGWLERFVQGVLASSEIQTASFRAHHARSASRGIVYLPTTSYVEMNEWTLPAPAAQRYADLVAREKAAGRYEADRPFLRGGIWRNFMSRYPEANWMHKRMLGLSDRLARLPPAARSDDLKALLYLGQANDAYWHGLFGGLYLPHLRRGVWHALLALEARLDQLAPRPPRERCDADADGVEELFLRSDALQAVLELDGSAALIELDAYALAQNFGDVLRRHAEPYHRKTLEAQASQHAGGGIASAHDRVSFKHAIAPEDVVPDEHARALFRDRWIEGERVRALDRYELIAGDAQGASASFRAPCASGRVEKTIAVQGDCIRVTWRFVDVAEGEFRTELNLALPSCDGPAGRYILRGEIVGGFGQPLDAEHVSELVADDQFMGGAVTITTTRAATSRCRAHMTVSQSEDGFEKIMQAATVTLAWPLAAGAHEFSVALRVTTSA
jgi:hypothetical protein